MSVSISPFGSYKLPISALLLYYIVFSAFFNVFAIYLACSMRSNAGNGINIKRNITLRTIVTIPNIAGAFLLSFVNAKTAVAVGR